MRLDAKRYGSVTNWVTVDPGASKNDKCQLTLKSTVDGASDATTLDIVESCFVTITPKHAVRKRMILPPARCAFVEFKPNSGPSMRAWSSNLSIDHWFLDADNNAWRPDSRHHPEVDKLVEGVSSGTTTSGETSTVPAVLQALETELQQKPGGAKLADDCAALNELHVTSRDVVLGWIQRVPTAQVPIRKVQRGPFTLLTLGKTAYASLTPIETTTPADVREKLSALASSSSGPCCGHAMRFGLQEQAALRRLHREGQERSPTSVPSVSLFESSSALHESDAHFFAHPRVVALDDGDKERVVVADEARSTLLRDALGLAPVDTEYARVCQTSDLWHADFVTTKDLDIYREQARLRTPGRNVVSAVWEDNGLTGVSQISTRVQNMYQAFVDEDFLLARKLADEVSSWLGKLSKQAGPSAGPSSSAAGPSFAGLSSSAAGSSSHVGDRFEELQMERLKAQTASSSSIPVSPSPAARLSSSAAGPSSHVGDRFEEFQMERLKAQTASSSIPVSPSSSTGDRWEEYQMEVLRAQRPIPPTAEPCSHAGDRFEEFQVERLMAQTTRGQP